MNNEKIFSPKWSEYYVAIVSLRESNPKHKVIIFINMVDDDTGDILYTPLTYGSNERYYSCNVHYFELIEKIDMDQFNFKKDELSKEGLVEAERQRIYKEFKKVGVNIDEDLLQRVVFQNPFPIDFSS